MRISFILHHYWTIMLASSSSNTRNHIMNPSRGAFIVFEGVDRCGKTTQTALLQERLSQQSSSTLMRFPDRTTNVGTLIDQYLQSSTNLDDRAIHLLFSANRWEASDTILQALNRGTTVVCDRYAYSGVAFSSAKVDAEGKPILSLEWCQAPDKGLPAPDCVIFLDLTQEEAEKRGGYGGERYEKREMQQRVRKRFEQLKAMDSVPWKVVNAAQSVEQVQADIWSVVQETLEKVKSGKPLTKMWEEGTVDWSKFAAQEKEN